MRMSHLKVGSSADIPLNITETDLSQLTATVIPPSGREEPCLLKRLRNGHVGELGRMPSLCPLAVCMWEKRLECDNFFLLSILQEFPLSPKRLGSTLSTSRRMVCTSPTAPSRS